MKNKAAFDGSVGSSKEGGNLPRQGRRERALVTEEDVRAAYKAGETRLSHPAGAIITPLARDAARLYGIKL